MLIIFKNKSLISLSLQVFYDKCELLFKTNFFGNLILFHYVPAHQ